MNDERRQLVCRFIAATAMSMPAWRGHRGSPRYSPGHVRLDSATSISFAIDSIESRLALLQSDSTMTVRRWNDDPTGAGELAPVVLILKKTQGSVWSEAGRTPLCPTLRWLHDNYGAGQYELRLKQGNRILCMASAECRVSANPKASASAERQSPEGRPNLPGSNLPGSSLPGNERVATTTSWLASGNERAPARIVLRGTALG